MNRGLVVKFVLGALVTLAAVDSAQAGRRSRRNNCCCDGYSSYGNRGMSYGCSGNSYANYTPMHSNAYVNNCCCQPTGTMMASGVVTAPYISGYADPNVITPSSGGTFTGDKARLRVQVPTAETRIWVDQHLVQSSGTSRSIDMPYTATAPQKVTITAQWMKDGREVVRKKEVEIRGALEATVSFTDADAMSPGEQIQSNPDKP